MVWVFSDVEYAVDYIGLSYLAPLQRVTPFDPAGKTLVENLHVAVAFLMENAIGQTGQVMGAGSV